MLKSRKWWASTILNRKTTKNYSNRLKTRSSTNIVPRYSDPLLNFDIYRYGFTISKCGVGKFYLFLILFFLKSQLSFQSSIFLIFFILIPLFWLSYFCLYVFFVITVSDLIFCYLCSSLHLSFITFTISYLHLSLIILLIAWTSFTSFLIILSFFRLNLFQ